MIKLLRNIVLALLLLLTTVWFVGTQPLLISPERVETPDVDSTQLERYVKHLSEVLPGRIGQESALSPTVEWIEQQIAPYGKSYRQSFEHQGETFHNILIDFGADTDNAESELIIIGAHYDTAHGFAGADDNASGVAGLIELARLLSEFTSKNEQQLTHRIQLAFYTLEEPPFFEHQKWEVMFMPNN